MIDSKRDILMYGSDAVFKTFNNYLVKSSENASCAINSLVRRGLSSSLKLMAM